MKRCPHDSRVADRPVLPTLVGRRARTLVALPLLAIGSLSFPPAAFASNFFVELVDIVTGGRGGVLFQVPQAVAINPRTGEFAVANTGRSRIDILDPTGHPAVYIAHRVRSREGALVPGQPNGVCYDAQGNLLVADNLDRGLDLLSITGKPLGRFELPGGRTATGAAFDSSAGATALLRDGSLLVGTRGDPARIHHFAANGRWLGAWGEPGDAPGHLSHVTGIAQAPTGDVLVICQATQLAVQRFDSTGVYLSGFGTHEIGEGNFSFPSGIAVSRDGRLWVSDQLRQSVQVYTKDGKYLGLAAAGGIIPGAVLFPTGVAADTRERLAVIDRLGGRLQIFRILDTDKMFDAPERR